MHNDLPSETNPTNHTSSSSPYKQRMKWTIGGTHKKTTRKYWLLTDSATGHSQHWTRPEGYHSGMYRREELGKWAYQHGKTPFFVDMGEIITASLPTSHSPLSHQMAQREGACMHLLLRAIFTYAHTGSSKFTPFQTGNTPFGKFWKHWLNPNTTMNMLNATSSPPPTHPNRGLRLL